MRANKFLGLFFILMGVGLVVWAGLTGRSRQTPLSSTTLYPVSSRIATPAWRDEPIVPTALPTPSNTFDPGQSLVAARQPISTGISTPSSITDNALNAASSLPLTPAQSLRRFGVGAGHFPTLQTEAAAALDLGWYLTWGVFEEPPGPPEAEFWQMVRVSETGFYPNQETIRRAARANLGATWLIGNEPDVPWQDNVTPARYAELYHDLYHLIKKVDPTAQIAIGGITQPSPLRYQYLEMILSSYQSRYGQEMPIDVWNIHNFILREEKDSWGVDIPPGLQVDHGVLFEINDHDDLEIFKSQIVGFRRWMADRGQRNKPLVVSEYGILMPPDYGFGFERVKRFMYGTYDFMLNATDKETGYPADGYRLVQCWAWYSLSTRQYPTGNLIDLETHQLTVLGKAHREYITELTKR